MFPYRKTAPKCFGQPYYFYDDLRINLPRSLAQKDFLFNKDNKSGFKGSFLYREKNSARLGCSGTEAA